MSFLICSVMGMGLTASGEMYLVKMLTASFSIPEKKKKTQKACHPESDGCSSGDVTERIFNWTPFTKSKVRRIQTASFLIATNVPSFLWLYKKTVKSYFRVKEGNSNSTEVKTSMQICAFTKRLRIKMPQTTLNKNPMQLKLLEAVTYYSILSNH